MHEHLPLRTTHLRIIADPRELDNERRLSDLERHQLGLYRLVAALSLPMAAWSPSLPLMWWRQEGEPDEWEHLKVISLSASIALSPHLIDVLKLLYKECEKRGIKISYVDAELDESGSEERKRANAAAFNEGFWEEVERLERR
ncbi:hypothetical protein JCM11251_000214 [Rhodosporidiobolus azoricus]